MSKKITLAVIIVILILIVGSGIRKKKLFQSETADAASTQTTAQKSSFSQMYKLTDGARPNWNPANPNLIAFDRIDPTTGYAKTWVINADGTGEKCLTCNPPAGFPTGNSGNPSWHPSGKYIAINVQQQKYTGTSKSVDALANPGIAFTNDIWVITPDGSKAWKIISDTVKSGYTPALYNARFSHDGKKIAWTHVVAQKGNWGHFTINVADFVATPTPHIVTSSIVTFDPGSAYNFIEVHGWSADDKKLSVAGNFQGQNEFGQDIGIFTIATKKVVDLTPLSNGIWTEAVQFIPNSNKLVFMSSEGYPLQQNQNWWTWLKTDYWSVNTDGSGKQRLTFFNDPKSAQYIKGIVNVAQFSFSPNGKRFVGTLNNNSRLELWMFNF